MSPQRLSPMQRLIIVVLSFAVASVINIYPMSLATSSLRPMALIMMLAFWLIKLPRHIGVGVAFIIGILADLLLDTRLGQQAFAAVIMAFSLRAITFYIKEVTLASAWVLAGLSLIIFQLTLWIVQFITQNIFMPSALLSLLVSIVTWPVIYIILHRFGR